ncbi:MAG TPA: hypothetical protein VLH38_02110 [Patescibacteria group bacterium]|nr:hypothetical protein [Patescibacteria group bacterium]
MTYGFMRNFDGVPFNLSLQEQRLARGGILEVTSYLYDSYGAGLIATEEQGQPGEVDQRLYLHLPTKELITAERTLSQGRVTRAIVDLAVMTGAVVTSRYTYGFENVGLRADNLVRRRDTPDVPAERAARVAGAQRLAATALPVQVWHPEFTGEHAGTSALENLYVDLVGPQEVTALYLHLANRVEESGDQRYRAVDYRTALDIEGISA